MAENQQDASPHPTINNTHTHYTPDRSSTACFIEHISTVSTIHTTEISN